MPFSDQLDMSLKRVPSESSIDLRPLKRNRSDASSYAPSEASISPIPDFVLSASAKLLPVCTAYHQPLGLAHNYPHPQRHGSFSSVFSTPPPSPRKPHGARLRSITPLPTLMDEAFADLETSMRSRTCTPAPDNFRFAGESARYNMESQPRSVIDFSLPVVTPSADGDENNLELSCPLSWSSQNILAFPRGNRVYLKNITSAVEDVGYTFKPSKKHGTLRMLDFCRDLPNLLALGTSTDNIELWDIEAKKMTRSWTATGITCLEWNEGRVLAVGDKKGSIQYYDTRIDDRKEMKMKKGKVTRHEAPITTISWNRKDPKYLASGDKDGVIYYWDSRQDAPLKMGEMVQRRRKMQHDHAVSASVSSL